MDIAVTAAQSHGTDDAVRELLETLQARATPPDFVAVHASAAYDICAMQGALASADIPCLHGSTSCLGVMANGAMVSREGRGVGSFAVWDPDGSYGTALAALGGDPAAAARMATLVALERAGRAGEAPDLVWISAAPGEEEAVVEGIQSVVGADTPVVGGSAADNDIAGGWRVFDAGKVAERAVVVSVLFPSRPLSTAYQNGYAPTGRSGIATRTEGRVLLEIDGLPAADVYAQWTAGAVDLPSARPAPILAASTFHPLGRTVATLAGVPFYLLAHPAVQRADGAIELFCEIPEGERVELMTGSADGLAGRAGRVASLATRSGGFEPADIAGALMVYCGGCMLAVRERMDDVAQDVNDMLGGAPSLGVFTFGEQGRALGGRNHHGNLMISCVAFAR